MKKQSNANVSIDTAHYTPEIIDMMDNAKKCLCCDTELKYTDKNKRRNRGYCSLGCYYKHPPKMAYISHTYEKPVRNAIVETLNACDSKVAAADLLGIGKYMLYEYIKKLGIREVVRYE